jgi:hypothetical protein
MNYRKLNVLLGWLVFLIATTVYFMTIEDTVSLWDCGEYIMAAYKLEVGHPPGAPLFMLLGRLFTFFAVETDVAVWINRMSALSSSFTILFMFWSITSLVRKMVLQRKNELSKGDLIAVMGSGVVGALAYTFSETFWFSAVEGEVYAMSSLFTAIVFWAILKWDEEMALLQSGKLGVEAAPNRWLLLIMFLIGLAIGVHLLGILLVPAIGYVIYFRLWGEVKPKTFILTGVISVILLAVIQEGVIPGTISMASSFEVTFRNSIGLPFFAGTIFFFTLLIGALIYGARYARKKGKTVLYNSLFGLIFLLIGYGSFAVIVIRSNADTPMDQNNPENLVNLHSYLKRDQYGKAPLLSGPYWNSKELGGSFDADGEWSPYTGREEWQDRDAVYARRFIVHKNDMVLKAFLKEADASKYAKENKAEYKEEFYEVNEASRKNSEPAYEQTTIFPRMYSPDEPRKVDGYKSWSGYDASRTDGEMGKDQLPLPAFSENMTYFFRYQVNWMYFRYFMWNFAGRQNDIQGEGSQMNGNWKSGFSFIDTPRLGDQSAAPYYTTNNKANNSFFFIPLILGLIGLFFHAYRSPKDAFIVLLGFLLTGLAIVIYLNQKVYEPRERDYAYAGSFYFFAMWIGVGVYALYHAFTSFGKEHFKKFGIIALAGLVIFFIIDMNSEESLPNTFSWLTIAGISLLLLGGMKLLGKVTKNETAGAALATILGLAAPVIMGAQGWDDHDRSNKTTAHDVAYNYMSSVSPNGIIFTNGDNDTFPLWYIQEVEGFRSDVRVCNLSLMQTDWYTAQMMRRTYDSDPLPIKFSQDQILMYTGGTDQIQFIGLSDLYFSNTPASTEVLKKIIDMRLKINRTAAVTVIETFANTMKGVISSFEITQPAVQNRLNQLGAVLTRPAQTNDLTNDIHLRFSSMRELFGAFQNQSIKPTEQAINGIQDALKKLNEGWEAIDLADVMNFVRDDANMLQTQGGGARFFPTSQFVLKVNKDNVLKSGIVPNNTNKSKLMDEVRFSVTVRALTREEVMMMDILANNEWKRGIYFSSPYGSQLSRSLLNAGALKQTGSTYEVNPLIQDAPIDVEEMYTSLMKTQHFGKMNDPKVLTDYYARRHVIQYRSQFASLVKYYLHQIQQAERVKSYPSTYLDMLKTQNTPESAEILRMSADADKIIADSKKKVSDLLNRAEEVMPVSIVLDGGEPNPASTFEYQGARFPRYSDGIVVDFVQMYYDADNVPQAEKLGTELEKQYRQSIEFFLNAPAHITLSSSNQPHFFVALDSYLQLFAASNEMNGNPNGKFAKQTQQYVQELFEKKLPELYRRLESQIAGSGEGNRARRAVDLLSLKDYIEALAGEYGFGKTTEPIQNSAPDMDFNQMIQEQLKQDSVLE